MKPFVSKRLRPLNRARFRQIRASTSASSVKEYDCGSDNEAVEQFDEAIGFDVAADLLNVDPIESFSDSDDPSDGGNTKHRKTETDSPIENTLEDGDDLKGIGEGQQPQPCGIDKVEPGTSTFFNTNNSSNVNSDMNRDDSKQNKGHGYIPSLEGNSFPSSITTTSLSLSPPMQPSDKLSSTSSSPASSSSPSLSSLSMTATARTMNMNIKNDSYHANSNNLRNVTFSNPSFSLYKQDTQHTSKPQKPLSFILNHAKNTQTQKMHTQIKKDGLLATALNYIEQEQSEFRAWQSSAFGAKAKYGSLPDSAQHDTEMRLCRLLEVWEEHGFVFGWCVDLTIDERNMLTNKDGNVRSQQSTFKYFDDIIVEEDAPLPQLPSYEPGEDDLPYICLFSMTYVDMPEAIKANLKTATYLGIWPPWTTIPISVEEDEDLYVHIITKFLLDDAS